MPLLIEDLAEEASASASRTADRLEAEARELEELALSPQEGLRERAIDAARHATARALAVLPQAEAAWDSACSALKAKPAADDAVRLLRGVLAQLEAGLRLLRSPRALWAVAERLGDAPERLAELGAAERRVERIASHVNSAIKHRLEGWKPADPERFEREMARVKDAKFLTTAEVLESFRRPQQ